MSLQLEFADRYELWGTFIHTRADRVLVPTDEEHRIGDAVPVELALPDLSSSIVMTGTVVGVRPLSERFPRALYIRFEEKELEKVRGYLQLSMPPTGNELGRRTSRVDCSLPLRFTVPHVPAVCEAKNLSETGLLARVSHPLVVGQRATLRLTLDNKEELSLNSEVSWARQELGLVGMQFLSLDIYGLEKIRGAIARMSKAQAETSRAILVAEDDPTARAPIVTTLKRQGYEVHETSRGDDALNLVRRLRPQLLILDVLLPGVDGKDVCKRVRADAEMSKTNILLISALDKVKLHSVALEAGASDYLPKPVGIQDLLALVRRYAGKVPDKNG